MNGPEVIAMRGCPECGQPFAVGNPDALLDPTVFLPGLKTWPTLCPFCLAAGAAPFPALVARLKEHRQASYLINLSLIHISSPRDRSLSRMPSSA